MSDELKTILNKTMTRDELWDAQLEGDYGLTAKDIQDKIESAIRDGEFNLDSSYGLARLMSGLNNLIVAAQSEAQARIAELEGEVERLKIDREAIVTEAKKECFNGRQFVNNGNGLIYTVLHVNVIDQTNSRVGGNVIVYRENGTECVSVRESKEFFEKFTEVISTLKGPATGEGL